MIKSSHNFFSKDPSTDTVVMIQNYLNKDRGLFFYFRTLCIRMQERFAQLFDHSDIPTVFLHGNPHLENYVKTEKGAAMVDFDRSRLGPYAWDLVRLLASISMRKQGEGKKFLPEIVVDYLYEGYRRGFGSSELGYKEISELAKVRPRPWQQSVNEYLKSDTKWARKIKEHPLSAEDPFVLGVLDSYLESRGEQELLERYQIESVGKAEGTLQNKRILLVMAPKDKKNRLDRILLDIKSVYKDPDNEWYRNPYDHHGLRMIKAAELYAPGIEERVGYATHNNEQYWGRAVPCFSHKIKTRLDLPLQLDLAYSVGTQLGQAHRKSVSDEQVEALPAHLDRHYKTFVKLAEQLSREVVDAHRLYIDALKRNKTLVLK